MTPPLRVIPIGGLGEIGKNMLALECGDDIVVVDCGLMFPEEDMLGVDLVIPDTSYLEENASKVRGILITHGHEDHIGALPYVLPRLKARVFAVGLGHDLVQVKLKEHRVLRDSLLTKVDPGESVALGGMSAQFFRVCHSIPDAMGVAVRTPQGLVVHTGDFKVDHTPIDGRPTDFQHLARLCSEGLLLLMSDSTYSELPGFTPSEAIIAEWLDRIIREAPGRVIVATFASLISRVQLVLDAAHKNGRKVAVLGRSMVDNVAMATKMGHLTAPDSVLNPWEKIKSLAPERLVVVTTGSQGEPTSGLTRIANRDHGQITITPGDTVIVSASPIPGNETVISRTIDNLTRQGARVLTTRNATVHVHGHASQEDLKLMLRVTQPRFFVPVHGEYRHLVAHSLLAQSVGVPPERAFVLEDGDVLELTEDGGSVVDRMDCGHIYVDGLRLWDPRSAVLRDRRMLSRDGVVMVVLTVDQHHGSLVRPPEIVSTGFADANEQVDLMERGSKAITESLSKHGDLPLQSDYIQVQVKETLGRFLYTETRRRPMILPVVVAV
ncbi:MAG: ribonuclease J [SAR202 cluster bacterium]|nr:ribonuclease J [SAR202 cluster bacterium]